MHYYQHHINDFSGGTKNFSRLERWLYRDMLEHYYDTEKPLPANFDLLCDELGIQGNEEMAAVSRVLRRKFTLTESGYRNERCDETIAAYHQLVEVARLNGKKGGRPKTHPVTAGNQSGTKQEPDGNQEKSDPKANQETSKPINQEPKEKVKSIVEPNGPTAEVFSYWQLKRNHPQAKLDAKRLKAIKGRLADGYTVGELCEAIDGCCLSPHHMGQNDTRTIYDDIELICRDGPRVDKFIKLARQGGAQGELEAFMNDMQQWAATK